MGCNILVRQSLQFGNPNENTHEIVTPDAAAYTAVILSHAKSNKSRQQAAAKRRTDGNAQHVRPDAIAITTCINAFVNVASKSSGNTRDRVPAQERAEALLLLMADLAKEEEDVISASDDAVKDENLNVDEYLELDEVFDDSFGDDDYCIPVAKTERQCNPL